MDEFKLRRRWCGALLLISVVFTMGCTPGTPSSVIIGLDPAQPTNTRAVIYVTPTNAPTPIPTVTVLAPTPMPSLTPIPTLDSSPAQEAERRAACAALLIQNYTLASELCVGKPNGYFCNGGMAPLVLPEGAVANSLALEGAQVEAALIEQVHNQPLDLNNNAMGLMWLRTAQAANMSALLVGDVRVRDITPEDSNLAAWRSMMVQTTPHTSACDDEPPSSFVVQGPYGETIRVVINGLSLDLRGTLVVQTHGSDTHFIALEGDSVAIIFGTEIPLVSGQQIVVPYAPGDFARPAGSPLQSEPLIWEHIADLPVVLLDRPVLLPQPGYIVTRDDTNLRAAPALDARSLYLIPPQQLLSVIGESSTGEWLHVRLGNNETGWMRADTVEQRTGAVTVAYDSTPLPPQRYGSAGKIGMVIAGQGGNMRVAPHTSFPTINTLAQGTEVQLLARSPYNHWVKVDSSGQVGWMSLLTLETQSVIGFLPIDYDVPLPPEPTAPPSANFFQFGGGHAYPDDPDA